MPEQINISVKYDSYGYVASSPDHPAVIRPQKFAGPRQAAEAFADTWFGKGNYSLTFQCGKRYSAKRV